MPNRHLARALGAVALVLSLAPDARTEVAAWDQARVTVLAKELAAAVDALDESFGRQPQPEPGSTRSRSYHALDHRVRMLGVESRMLVQSLEEGEGREQTLWIYDNLLSHGRSARYEARSAALAEEVGERAGAVRAALNQLGPFYDPDFQVLAPDPNLESGATR